VERPLSMRGTHALGESPVGGQGEWGTPPGAQGEIPEFPIVKGPGNREFRELGHWSWCPT